MNENLVDTLHILVVDDEDVVRASLANWFEADGHDVGAAADLPALCGRCVGPVREFLDESN